MYGITCKKFALGKCKHTDYTDLRIKRSELNAVCKHLKMSYHMGPWKKFALYSYPNQYSYKIIQKYFFFHTNCAYDTTRSGSLVSGLNALFAFLCIPPPPRDRKAVHGFLYSSMIEIHC